MKRNLELEMKTFSDEELGRPKQSYVSCLVKPMWDQNRRPVRFACHEECLWANLTVG